MREAMAAAEVGDDVFGEDPTVNRLQERAAALVGAEAALFVPSGSMANQIALLVHCQKGDDVIIGEGAHNVLYESGAAGAIAGVQFTVVGRGGLYTADEAAPDVKPDNHHNAPTRLLCVEDTHNRGGGRVWPRAQLAGVLALARERGLATHLDGARLFNAATALGCSAAELAAGFDTVSFCFSKGLGAPVGSVLCGSQARVHRAHRFRKMLGGGMRQAGVLAAAALWALDHNVARLGEDHAHARMLADAVAEAGGARVTLAPVETNIVIFDVPDAPGLVARLREAGVLMLALGPGRVRAVTHLDVGRGDMERAVATVRRALQ
ncbi:MAG TPA: low-specificity L-threonine aldolase [Myxococcota bacterium]|jgi:threonine aldolase|nr:low-specificity L-threonine aldolase [Myxococcota bacterium]